MRRQQSSSSPPPPPSPQWSTDGEWWWDGSSWMHRSAFPAQVSSRHVAKPPRVKSQKSSCLGVPVGFLVLLAIGYVVYHYTHYSACQIQPDLFNWQTHCPYYLPRIP
jgi:hypothetical protein